MPHAHHSGNGIKRILTGTTVSHLEVCAILGRAIATHNSTRDALAHMVKQCGLTDAAVVETPVTAADGDTTIADVLCFDSLSGERAILEVSVVHCGIRHFTGPNLARGDGQCHGVAAGARTRETRPSRHSDDNKLSGKQHNFYPHPFVGLWSDGPFDGGLREGCLRSSK